MFVMSVGHRREKVRQRFNGGHNELVLRNKSTWYLIPTLVFIHALCGVG
jgi:hypothetical protein